MLASLINKQAQKQANWVSNLNGNIVWGDAMTMTTKRYNPNSNWYNADNNWYGANNNYEYDINEINKWHKYFYIN